MPIGFACQGRVMRGALLLGGVLWATGCGGKAAEPTGDVTGGTGGNPTRDAGGSGGTPGTGGSGGSVGGAGGAAAGSGGSAATGDAQPNPGAEAGSPVTPPPDDDSYLQRVVPILWLTMDGARQPNRVDPIPGTMQVIEQHAGNQITSIARAAGRPRGADRRSGSAASARRTSMLRSPTALELQDAAGADLDRVAARSTPGERLGAGLLLLGQDLPAQRPIVRTGPAVRRLSGVWAPRTRFAEVYLDGNYRGLYQLVEKPKGSRVRMNLKRPNPPDLTGAYMFSSDGDMTTYRYNPLVPMREWFDARRQHPLGVPVPRRERHHPRPEGLHHRASTASRPLCRAGPTAWRPRVDVRSWMDYFVMSELSNNVDAFFRSWYIHKQSDVGRRSFRARAGVGLRPGVRQRQLPASATARPIPSS